MKYITDQFLIELGFEIVDYKIFFSENTPNNRLFIKGDIIITKEHNQYFGKKVGIRKRELKTIDDLKNFIKPLY